MAQKTVFALLRDAKTIEASTMLTPEHKTALLEDIRKQIAEIANQLPLDLKPPSKK